MTMTASPTNVVNLADIRLSRAAQADLPSANGFPHAESAARFWHGELTPALRLQLLSALPVTVAGTDRYLTAVRLLAESAVDADLAANLADAVADVPGTVLQADTPERPAAPKMPEAERTAHEAKLLDASTSQSQAAASGDVLGAVEAYRVALEAARALECYTATPTVYAVTKGRKYWKVTSGHAGNPGSVHSFVDDEGNIWKPASYSAPAKNFPRGNVLTLDLSTARHLVYGL